MTAIHLHHGARAHRPTLRWPRLGATLREWRRRVRDRGQLAQLDERMLGDIGLTRADAEYLINKPFWRE